MTAFIANIVRDSKKHPEPYTHNDFLVDWTELWDTVVERAEQAEDSPEAVEALNQELRGKVIALNTWFGGVDG